MTALTFDPARPWLAPLAGYSDLPFRMLCREYGAGVCCTEMVSAKGLVYKSPGTQDLLRTVTVKEAPNGLADAPLVVQLFGNEASFLVQAMEQLQELGFIYFDLNMGCSVPKVNRTGSGSAMLKDIDNALHVARAMVRAGGEGRVGFKFRLGWDAQNDVWQDLGPALQDCGAAWLTLHPRYARQGFGGTAYWPALEVLCRKVSIPVIASGDIFTAYDGVRCIEETGVATVMYARGAMQDPAVFGSHTSLWQARHPQLPQAVVGDAPLATMGTRATEPVDATQPTHPTQPRGQAGLSGASLSAETAAAGTTLPSLVGQGPHLHSRQTLRAMIARHGELAMIHGSERAALFKMRTFVPRYVHHLPGVRALRQGLSNCTDWDSINALLDTFLEEQTNGS